MNNSLDGFMFFGKMIQLKHKLKARVRSTENRKHSLNKVPNILKISILLISLFNKIIIYSKVALRANLLQPYLHAILKHQGFLNFFSIREVDLFGIDKVKISLISCLKFFDFGNDENLFSSIKSFSKFMKIFRKIQFEIFFAYVNFFFKF